MKKGKLENRSASKDRPLYVKTGDGTMTAGELLLVLGNKAFSDNAPVYVQTDNHNGPLTVAYMCPKSSGCGMLHLIAAVQWQDTGDESDFRVMINRVACDDADGVIKSELENVLRSVDKDTELTVSTSFDGEGKHGALVTALKCDHCESVHLSMAEYIPN